MGILKTKQDYINPHGKDNVMELKILHINVYHHSHYLYLEGEVWYPSKVSWADGKEASNFLSAIETMSTFTLIMVSKSVNVFLTKLILR